MAVYCATADAFDFFREKNARVLDFSRRLVLSAVLFRVGGLPARSSSSSYSAAAGASSAYFSLCILSHVNTFPAQKQRREKTHQLFPATLTPLASACRNRRADLLRSFRTPMPSM
jgi:hypothetical protein